MLMSEALIAQEVKEVVKKTAEIPQQQLQQLLSDRPEQFREEELELDYYGYDFFAAPREPLASASGRLPPDYLLGSGDQLGVYLTGKIAEEFPPVIVNVEGKVFLRSVGVLPVQGLTIGDFKAALTERLSSLYDNFNVEVLLIAPKTVQVSVAGEVFRPGRYALSALNSVFDALSISQGAKLGGSLRDIQLYRNGSFYASIDLYDFLMNQVPDQEMLLHNGDRIFVPLVEKAVAVFGEVKRPGIYELHPGKEATLADAINLAGGLTDVALPERIELSRLNERGQRTLLSASLEASASAPLRLQNNDRIRVFSKLKQQPERIVSIYGAVATPGQYLLEENMHLSDLLYRAGNLTRDAYLLEAEVAKIDPKLPPAVVTVNLGQLLNGRDDDILLEEDDQVFIRTIPQWEVGPTVEVRGEVMFPGYYPISKDSTYLSDIMDHCGGFTDDALIRESKLIRRSAKLELDREYERLKEMTRDQMTELEYDYMVMKENTRDLGQIVVDFFKVVVERDRSQDVLLEDGDIIEIPKTPLVVGVTGRVAKPGGVLYKPGKKFNYYIEGAGGFAWDARKHKSKVIKVSGEIVDDEDAKELVAGDIIYVPRKRETNYWEIFRQTILVVAQIATIVLVIQNTQNN